jgi:hypothetical protein
VGELECGSEESHSYDVGHGGPSEQQRCHAPDDRLMSFWQIRSINPAEIIRFPLGGRTWDGSCNLRWAKLSALSLRLCRNNHAP